MTAATQQVERVTRNKEHLQLQWRHDLAPLAQVAIGETLVVETADNFALFREMNSEDDLVDSMSLDPAEPAPRDRSTSRTPSRETPWWSRSSTSRSRTRGTSR